MTLDLNNGKTKAISKIVKAFDFGLFTLDPWP